VISAGALPQTRLGELTALPPDFLVRFQGPGTSKGKGEERYGMGVEGTERREWEGRKRGTRWPTSNGWGGKGEMREGK